MKLTVMMPVYNEHATLQEILRRVQEVPVDKEIIIVDNCSTDGTREELQAMLDAGIDWRGLWSGDAVRRRRTLKEISYRLPMRPLLRFFYMYLWRRGFLDGWQGYAYCKLLAAYEFMIVLKTRELRRRQQGQPV